MPTLSQKAMNKWNKANQTKAIDNVVAEKGIRGPRLAKAKAMSQKVWVGAAPTGPKTADTQRKRSASSAQVPETTKRFRKSSSTLDREDPIEDSERTEIVPDSEMNIVSEPDVNESQETSQKPRKRRGNTCIVESDDEEVVDPNEPDWGAQRPKPAQTQDDSELESANEETEERDADTEVESEGESDVISKKPTRLGAKLRIEKPQWSDLTGDSSVSLIDDDVVAAFTNKKSTAKGTKQPDVETNKGVGKSKDGAPSSIMQKTSTAAVVVKKTVKTLVSDVKSCKQQQWRTDDVVVQEGPAPKKKQPAVKKEPQGDAAGDGGRWPSDTNLKSPDGGGKLHLLHQHKDIQNVLREAIKQQLSSILFEDSFPNLKERTSISRDAVLKAARTLKHTNMVRRLTEDLPYLHELAKLVEARISAFRLGVKKSCSLHVASQFGMKAGSGAAARQLIESREYIYPVQGSQVKRNAPYGNPIFLAVLSSTVFKDSTSIGFELKDLFYSSVEGLDDELEIPPTMMAFIATCVHVAIEEWVSGAQVTKTFAAKVITAIYDKHMTTLHGIAERKLGAYHKLMFKLYMDAANDGRYSLSGDNGMLDDIDFDGMED